MRKMTKRMRGHQQEMRSEFLQIPPAVLNLRGSKGERAPEALTRAPPAGSGFVCEKSNN